MAIWLRAREEFEDNRFQLLFIYIYIYIYIYIKTDYIYYVLYSIIIEVHYYYYVLYSIIIEVSIFCPMYCSYNLNTVTHNPKCSVHPPAAPDPEPRG